MTRRRNEDDLSHFSGAVAARLRELRDDKGWSAEELADKIRLAGTEYVCKVCGRRKISTSERPRVPCCWPYCDGRMDAYELSVPIRTIHSWENSRRSGGANIPVDMYPVIARVFGYRTVTGWLPEEFPSEL